MVFLSLISLFASARPAMRMLHGQNEKHYHVLLIGVPQPDGTLFARLDAVDNDLKDLAAVLEKNWHVPHDAIVIETSHDKTSKEQIVSLIKKTLIEPCAKGDVVYFGYSGHGYQVFDDSKATKLSQAIVPATVRYLTADDPKRGLKLGEVDPDSLLTGPEIGKLFDPLKNVTANVTLTFDSCHSGQITRGSFTARGRDNPAVARYLSRGTPQQPEPLSHDIVAGRGLVCLSAAAPTQLAWESEEGGAFTRALVRALQNPGTGQRTYESLFNQIRAECKNEKLPAPQDPQIEGDRTRTILGNEYIAPRASMEVHWEGDHPVMMGGRVVGMKPGFVVGIYPEGTTEFSGTPKWTATITKVVDTGKSILELSDESKKALNGDHSPLNANAQAIVIDGKPDGSIRVYTGDLAPDLRKALSDQLKNSPIVDPEAKADGFDFRISPSLSAGPGNPNQWDLVEGTEGLKPNPPESFTVAGTVDAQAEQMAERLQGIARGRAVQSLAPDGNPDTVVEMQLVQVDVANRLVTKLYPDKPVGSNQNKTVVFAVRIHLKKVGQSTAPFDPYIALLNVNPNPVPPAKSVEQLWPTFDPDGTVSSEKQFRRLTLGSGWRYLGVNNDLVTGDKAEAVAAWNVDADTDGLGPELFKIFATDQDENFAPLLDRSRGAKGASSVLGRTLGNFAKDQPRSRGQQATDNAAVQQWCTASVTLNVVANPKSEPSQLSKSGGRSQPWP